MAQTVRADNKPVKVSLAKTKMVAPLKGVIRCGHCGCAMAPTYSRNNDRQYTYYICQKDTKRAVSRCPLKRVPAGELMNPGNDQPDKDEALAAVNRKAVDLSRQLAGVASRCRSYQRAGITEQDVSGAFANVETFWKDLFPVERNRLIRLLVEKVEIRETGIDMELKTNGLTTLITELAGMACEVNERRTGR